MPSNEQPKPTFASWDSYSRFARRVRCERRFILNEEDRLFLETVLATAGKREGVLEKGRILYRAQHGVEVLDRTDDDGNWIGEDIWAHGSERMKPLTDRAREGRANPTGIPVLYVGSTVETAVSEVRPWIGAELSVARCRLLKPLRTLDLSVHHGKSSLSGPIFGYILGTKVPSAEEIETAVWTDIDNAFSQPVTQMDDRADYAPTQLLAELFRTAGYDAIGYKSHFGDTDDRGGYNIAIFDPEAVEIASCAPFRVSSIKVSAEQFHNEWVRSKGNE